MRTIEKHINKIVTIFMIATLVVISYAFANATNTTPESESINYWEEDNYCLAPCEGIVLQDVQFTNGNPVFKGLPVVFSSDCCETLTKIFNSEDDTIYPIAAIAFYCGEYIVVELD